jgi:hypothetical protein
MPYERNKVNTRAKVDLEALHDASRDKRICDLIKAVLLCLVNQDDSTSFTFA